MKMDSLHQLYLQELRDLYSAEKQILEAMPRMIRSVGSGELQSAFQGYLELAEKHVGVLEGIFSALDENPMGKMCHGMEGVLEEGSDALQQSSDNDVRDAGLIAAMQHVQHYEIAGYGTVAAYAELLGYQDAAEKLRFMLGEEKDADQDLSALALSGINLEAAA